MNRVIHRHQIPLNDADRSIELCGTSEGRASLSPAATPVSEAGPVATERPYWRDYPADQKVSPALAFDGGCLTINGQGYGDRDGAGVFAFKDDDLRWGHGEDEGYRYVHVGKSDLEAIRQAIASAHGPYALAKPASEPVGLTDAEQKQQAERCSCRGVDDYCPCQNAPDTTTIRNRSGA